MHEPFRLANADIELHVNPAGGNIRLINTATGTIWELDPATVCAEGSGEQNPLFGSPGVQHQPVWASADTGKAFALKLSQCEPRGVNVARLVFEDRGCRLVTLWEIRPDGLEVTALAAQSTATACSLPGAFNPSVGGAAAIIPVCQGVWHRGTGKPFAFNIIRNGHTGWSMPFAAIVGERDALLQIAASEHDARLWFELHGKGGLNVAWLQDPSRGALRYDRTTILKFTAPSVAAVARAYRDHIIQKGQLKTWDAKITERPNLEKLFGAVMCFIGYCRDDQIDYAGNFRRLKAMGVEKAFVYPLSMGNVVKSFKMGGREPIDIRRHLGLLDELGYLAASWMWVEDVPADPADNLMLDPKGAPYFSWQIDAVKWFKSCPVRGVALANLIQRERMAGHSAQHFDVTASRPGMECHHPDHPIDRRDDALWRRNVLETACARGNVVSSEGFWGYATPSYDIGSVKIATALHGDWFTIPLTSLVYHDSCIHDWWEVDNYNNARHRSQGGRGQKHFPLGGGFMEQQAAQDALAGWPPNVMPFGAQYQYVEGHAPETELYRFDLETPEVETALKLAIPVARLHGRIGKLACVDHKIHSPDGAIQSTTFADGTSVCANFGTAAVELPDFDRLVPQSWKSIAG